MKVFSYVCNFLIILVLIYGLCITNINQNYLITVQKLQAPLVSIYINHKYTEVKNYEYSQKNLYCYQILEISFLLLLFTNNTWAKVVIYDTVTVKAYVIDCLIKVTTKIHAVCSKYNDSFIKYPKNKKGSSHSGRQLFLN